MPAGADELKPLVDATAGATGALLTNIMLSPVDIAKTRMQTGRSKDGVLETIREIVEADGVAGCFKGIGLKSVETVLRNFLYFYAYEWLKATYYHLGYSPSTLGHTACGVLAGVSNLTITMPIDTLNVRIQSDSRNRSAREVARELVADGLQSMWTGFGVSSILTLNPALTFAIFDSLKARVLKLLGARNGRSSGSLTAAQAFVLGSTSKVIATILTYPLMRAKSIMQVQAKAKPADDKNGEPPPRRGLIRVLLDVIEQEGVAGLYRGCAAQIFTAVTKSGILLTTKEQLAAFAMTLVLMVRGRQAARLSSSKARASWTS